MSAADTRQTGVRDVTEVTQILRELMPDPLNRRPPEAYRVTEDVIEIQLPLGPYEAAQADRIKEAMVRLNAFADTLAGNWIWADPDQKTFFQRLPADEIAAYLVPQDAEGGSQTLVQRYGFACVCVCAAIVGLTLGLL